MTLLVGSIFHMTRKIVSEMTYNVSMGTLNPTILILILFAFLRASAMLKHVIDIGWTSVRCPSVCPSHAGTVSKRLNVLSWFLHHTIAHSFYVLCVPRSSRNSDGVTPYGGAKYTWGIKIARFSTNKPLYLANDKRYRHGCYGRRIGNHTQTFEWHQFQWPWETSKPVFKVTILFNVK